MRPIRSLFRYSLLSAALSMAMQKMTMAASLAPLTSMVSIQHAPTITMVVI